MTTGEKLQKLRKENNYTQEELAEIMNVSRQSISKWESDVAFPETEKLISLSKLYNCSIDYLLNAQIDEYIKKNNNEAHGSVWLLIRKRMPLIISSLSTYFFLFIFFAFPWLISEGYFITNSGVIMTINSSFYGLTKIVGDPVVNAAALKNLSIVTIVFLSLQAITSFMFIFFDLKGLKIAIRVSNIVLFVLMLLFALLTIALRSYNVHMTVFFYFSFTLTLILMVIQYAVKPIRKTR
ncbi:MAG: helix-turn-helix transcriptional regulator [Bacilli bacterium]|nr:helix-turn-helix transcriptional regulator [Bacilli bacterium]